MFLCNILNISFLDLITLKFFCLALQEKDKTLA